MKLTRRHLLTAGLATAAGLATKNVQAAIAPDKPSAGTGQIGPSLKLSCAAYSFRDYLPRDGKSAEMTLFDWLDLAAVWGLDAVELTSYYFTSEEPKYLHHLKAKAFKLGLDISATSVGNSFCHSSKEERAKQIDDVKRWIDHSMVLGAPCMRVFAGGKPKDGDRKRDQESVVECLKTCCDYAGERGVFLALENHGYLTETAADILDILNQVNHEWLGINLDTGNFISDPYGSIALALPKTLTTHIKTEVKTADGKGTAPLDLPRLIRMLRENNYRGYISLEYEAKEDAKTGVPNFLTKIRNAMSS